MSVSLLSGATIPLCRFGVIYRDALAIVIQYPQMVLCLGMPLFGGAANPFCRIPRILPFRNAYSPVGIFPPHSFPSLRINGKFIARRDFALLEDLFRRFAPVLSQFRNSIVSGRTGI